MRTFDFKITKCYMKNTEAKGYKKQNRKKKVRKKERN